MDRQNDNWLSDAPLGEWEGVYTNDAATKVQEMAGQKLGSLTGGLKIPGLM